MSNRWPHQSRDILHAVSHKVPTSPNSKTFELSPRSSPYIPVLTRHMPQLFVCLFICYSFSQSLLVCLLPRIYFLCFKYKKQLYFTTISIYVTISRMVEGYYKITQIILKESWGKFILWNRPKQLRNCLNIKFHERLQRSIKIIPVIL